MANKFEQLALWYLRLNGYLTVTHFILHPTSRRRSQRAEVDILGVRFPHSEEVAGAKMKQNDKLELQGEKIDFIIAEVKGGRCDLNGPWTKPNTENWDYVVKWLGIVPETEVSNVARELYLHKRCERENWVIRLLCFGSETGDLPANVVPLIFKQVIEFMSDRFKQFRGKKRDIEQWPPFIKELFDMIITKRPNEILGWLRN